MSFKLNSEHSKDHSRESLIKISSILNVKYVEINDQIEGGYTVKLVDEETNNFMGIFNVGKAREIAQKEGKDLVLVNKNSEPKLCKLMNYRKDLYTKFLKEVVEKEMTIREKLKNKSEAKVRRVHLNSKITVFDMRGKLNRLLDSCGKLTEKIEVYAEVEGGEFSEAKAMLHNAERLLQKKATASGRVTFETDEGEVVNEEEGLGPQKKKEKKRDPVTGREIETKIYGKLQFKLGDDKSSEGGFLDGIELTEDEVFELADELFKRRGISATNFDDRASVVHRESISEFDETPEDEQLKCYWIPRYIKKERKIANYINSFDRSKFSAKYQKIRVTPNEEPISFLEALRAEPDLEKAIFEDLKRLNLEPNETNVKSHILRSMKKSNPEISSVLKMFGLS